MKMCGIMRVEKRGRSAVFGLQMEANRIKADHDNGRDFDRSDIDWNKTSENINLIQTEKWQKEITKQIHETGVKERKNSTVLIDGLYTASPEWFSTHSKNDWINYFCDCLNFHIQEYCQGSQDRIINAVIHLDEATPHMQVASVPIYQDEKGYHLAAKDILGGHSEFRKRQDRFFNEVTKKRGLERGEVKDPAEVKLHTTKREWQLATQDEQISEKERELEQKDEQLAVKNEQMLQTTSALVNLRKLATDKEAEIRKNNELLDKINSDILKAAKEQGIPIEDFDEMIKKASRHHDIEKIEKLPDAVFNEIKEKYLSSGNGEYVQDRDGYQR